MISGGQTISKLDLSSTYQLIPLVKDPQVFVTKNTYIEGSVLVHIATLGVASVPAIFWHMIKTVR